MGHVNSHQIVQYFIVQSALGAEHAEVAIRCDGSSVVVRNHGDVRRGGSGIGGVELKLEMDAGIIREEDAERTNDETAPQHFLVLDAPRCADGCRTRDEACACAARSELSFRLQCTRLSIEVMLSC
mmetsp:Transcript_26432/g.55828  ORF Transcript_26432/g.55828 Transcript_26432/m.55828 type:complete len:126 (+) Transcript_26432:2494-2871(+)